MPLFYGGEVVGVLNVESTQGIKLTEADLRLMTALSEHISMAIGRARLYADIRTSEERYRTLAESAPDAIFIFDQDGVLSYLNSAASQHLGMLPEQIIGQNIQMLLRLMNVEDSQLEMRQLFDGSLKLHSETLIPDPGPAGLVRHQADPHPGRERWGSRFAGHRP